MLYLKLCGFAALIGTSPYWLWQIWAFVLPGLHAEERKWSYVFLGAAAPLFLAGIALAYLTLPKGLEVLIGLNPDGITNLVEFTEYLQFFTRTMLVFGIAFEIPVFVVLLNLAGVAAGQDARRLPALDHRRHLRLRRGRHALDRPLHHDLHGRADGGAVLHLGGHRPVQRPATRPQTPVRRPVPGRGIAPVISP